MLYVLPLLLPHLGERRKKEAQRCLDLLYDWQKWLAQGGKSVAARKGGLASAEKKRREKQLLEAKSNVPIY